ncbi:hypothetical protein N665_0610s0009, partial [Sinapis alba]
IILVHLYEGLVVLFSRKVELHQKYFPLKTLASKESGNCINRHNCLPSKARLNSWINMNLIPSSSLDLHNFSHFTQCIPLLGGFELHQNYAMALAKFSQV